MPFFLPSVSLTMVLCAVGNSLLSSTMAVLSTVALLHHKQVQRLDALGIQVNQLDNGPFLRCCRQRDQQRSFAVVDA
jgi:hypothetical protein